LYIALDAMGGDNAPQSNVKGAVLFAKEYNIGVYLVGNKEVLERELEKAGGKGLPIEIVHAEEVIGMDEPPSVAVRKKRKSSMYIAGKLVREGKAQAFVSAGNTGAAMAISKFVVGAAEGMCVMQKVEISLQEILMLLFVMALLEMLF